MERCPPELVPTLLAVAEYRNYLYAVSGTGLLLPLYYYGPLNSPQPPGDVPFASQWAEYIRCYVTDFYPAPRLMPEQVPHTIGRDFGFQSRADAGSRTWEQAVYRGWPLYIFGDGTRPDPDYEHFEPHDDERHLFRRVPTDIPFGPITGNMGDETVRIPPGCTGP